MDPRMALRGPSLQNDESGRDVPHARPDRRTLRSWRWDPVRGRSRHGDRLCQYGLAVIDDSETMLFSQDGWVASRDEGASDVYLFAYGLDYRAALKAFYAVSGKAPLIPRWALGNWWSRYCERLAMSI